MTGRVINMCCCSSYQGQIDFPDFLMENLGIYPLNIFVAKEKSIKKLFFLLTWRAIASLKRIYGLAWNLLLIYQLKSYIYVENIMITSGQLKWKVYFCQSSIIVMEFFLIFRIFWSVGVSVCHVGRSVCHNFRKGMEVSLPCCSYQNTCHFGLPSAIPVPLHSKE